MNEGVDVEFEKKKRRGHGGWIGRYLGKGKDRDQNMATGNAEGRWEGRKGMAKGTQRQATVEGKTGAGQSKVDIGRGKEEEYEEDGRVGRCWRAGQHRRGGAEVRSQNEVITGAELSAGQHERQVEVKVDA